MKTICLDASYDYNFDLIGLVCSAKDFKLAWYLNGTLGIGLERKEDIKLDFSDHSFMLISNFLYENEVMTFGLLRNKLADRGNLSSRMFMSELKQFDYLLKFKDKSEELPLLELLGKLKKIPIIEYVMQINFEQLKSKENLLY